MTTPAQFTAVFNYDIRQFEGNPHHVDTPFGRPVAVQNGNALTTEMTTITEQRDIAVEALRVAEANMFNVAIALASGGTKIQANKDLHDAVDRARAALKACGVSE